MLPAKPIDDSAHGAAAALNAGKFANGDEEKALEIQAEALTVGLGLNGTGKVPLSVGFARGTHLQYEIAVYVSQLQMPGIWFTVASVNSA